MKKSLISTATGHSPADLILKNCRIVDVFTGTVIDGSIAIKDGVIAGVGSYWGPNEKDMRGRYVMPGFIDSHAHIESSMVTPEIYAEAVVPKGITTVIADPHEIANVCGRAGVEFMAAGAAMVPLRIRFMVPSCVPALPSEHSGAVIDSAEVRSMLRSGDYLGLGEMMNYPGVIRCDPEVLAKLDGAGFADGHAPSLTGNDLNAYIAAGIGTDHECVKADELREKISKGMYVQIREGTLSKNLTTLMKGVDRHTFRRCLFCSDDRSLEDIVRFGTVNHCITKAVEAGISPIDAIIIATWNAAECYGLKGFGAVAPGYAADLIVSEELSADFADEVYIAGNLVAENGRAVFPTVNRKEDPLKWPVYKTVRLPDLTTGCFTKTGTDSPDDSVIGLVPGTITTKHLTRRSALASGCVLSMAAVVERYGNTGGIGLGPVAGYGIKNGAIASTIGHDSHNLTVIGDNEPDMIQAAKALGTDGGICVVSSGVVLAKLALPVGGLMSEKPIAEVLKSQSELMKAVGSLGIESGIDPFMALAFLPLPVIPEIRLTDRGLFDVVKFDWIK